MRILRYDLTAFGSFTGLSLDLSAPGVHLVTGPNEAGKSTALYALGQLLYGIDVQSHHDFVHAKSSLRLGARLQASDGAVLEIIRTKARKNSLIGPGGTPIDESRLAALLGGIDRRTFTTEFALSSAELRRGGRALVEGGGHVGQALAASRSGLVLTRVQKDIEARRAELYLPRGSKPVINVRIRELKKTQARKGEALLRPERYRSQEREVKAARRELDRISAELTAARGTRSRLERLEQALPALARRSRLLADIDAVRAEGVLAPPDVTERLPELMREIREAERLTAAAKNQIADLDLQLAKLSVDERLLAHIGEIERLAQERQAVEDAAQSLARSTGTVGDLRAEAGRVLTQVHPKATLADRHVYEVPEAVRSRARDLREEYAVLDAALDQSRHDKARRRRKLAEAEQRLATLPPAADGEKLRAALAAIPQDLLTRMTGAQESEHKHRGKAELLCGELRLSAIPEALIVPTREQVTAHTEALGLLRAERREHTKRAKTVTGRLADRRLELAALLKHDPPPTGDELAAARTARDDLWSAFRDAGRPEAARAEAYERAVEYADRVADQMFRNAERITTRLRLELDIAKDEQAQDALAQERRELDRRAVELDEEWTRLWADYAGPAPGPNAATTTLDGVRELREALHDLGDARSSLDTLRAQAVQHVTRLRELLGDPGGPVSENVLAELPELQEIAAAGLKERDAAASERRAAEEHVDAQRAELAEAAALVSDREALLAEWAENWRQVLGAAGLSADRDAVGALADLDRLAQVVAKVSEADRVQRESERAADRVEQFHDALRRLADACEQPLPADHGERYAFIGRLHTHAKEHRSLAERRDLHRQELARLRTELATAQEAEKRLHAELAAMLTKAGVDTVDALDEAVWRRQRHNELTEKLSDVTGDIALGAETLEQLSAEARRTTPDELQIELTSLTERITDLETRRDARQESLARLQAELDRLDGSAVAAQAAAEAEITAAALVEEVEEYLRLEIAHTILCDYIEDYRNAQQDPVLHRAGRLFQELTLRRFSGLQLDHDAPDPIVLAQRDNGDLLHTHQLSEGTADQLYLALRLASLERYAVEDRGLPFSLDDIFMTFDEARTSAALRVLDGMADRFQMIIFTHHGHLAELARKALPDGRAHVHRLPEFHPAGRVPTPGRAPVPEPRRQPQSERSCRTCGTTLTYSGRGRPPVRCSDCSGRR